MSATLIIGHSGTGKSTSIRTLSSTETLIINVLDKPLPFRGFKKNYIPMREGEGGNYFASDNYTKILACINHVNEKRPDITNLIIDDFQYLMANEFMRRASEKGYEKFVDLANHAWQVINALTSTRSDLYCFVLSHSETDVQGKSKCKTIGKMLDEKITIEGMFTVCLNTAVIDDEYKFLTRNDGMNIAKSPLGMFADKYIPNDLQFVKEQMTKYNTGEE